MPSNRLAHEKSPYLLQHAHNPVDWYPWGPAALEKARQEDKPIFLSVGYSTCHWCHVMERESFENEDVARILNEHFVPVKVDREERPDLDRVYMLFVQASTGSGGWPMSVWLTPEGKPFFGGTYFPPDTRYGRPGFGAILKRLAQAWREDRGKIEESGAHVLEQLVQYSQQNADGGGQVGQNALDSAFYAFRRSFDARLGGFGAAPKFPRPSIFNFLLRYGAGTGNEEARDMVLVTLRAMAKGGMHDQLGGGFHRYSVDENWFVPHFEKMLYDQAQLAISYLEAYQITGDSQYSDVARDIFDYVLRDLTHRPEGGFYSAEDADSAADPARPKEKSEGAFYIWSYQEIVDVLGEPDAVKFSRRFGVEPGGNVQEDPHGEFNGRNILYQAHDVMDETIPRSIAKLLEVRSRRPRPHLDDKILAGWNGMMISAFAKGAQILGETRYEQAARDARNLLRRHLWREADSTLLRRYRDSDAAIEAFLDDYAALINALVDLYETSFDPADLTWAAQLAERAIALFQDAEGGGFFSSPSSQSDLVLRLKDDYDGAEPSGNSVMALALLRLARITGREDFRRSAERTLEAFSGRMLAGGSGLPQMLVAQMFAMGKPMEIVLAGPRDQQAGMLAEIRKHFLPNAVVMQASEASNPMPPIDGIATAYVCENFACKLPAIDVGALAESLQP